MASRSTFLNSDRVEVADLTTYCVVTMRGVLWAESRTGRLPDRGFRAGSVVRVQGTGGAAMRTFLVLRRRYLAIAVAGWALGALTVMLFPWPFFEDRSINVSPQHADQVSLGNL